MYLYGIEIILRLALVKMLLCFNCTFMELKFRERPVTFLEKISFNCTFMELKYVNVSSLMSGLCGFNCTFMELKLSEELWKSMRIMF